MGTWPNDELHRIAETDDLHVSPFRDDGVTYGTPTWIWSVAVDDGLYARAYNGHDSRWYQAAMKQKAGRITAAGMTREVTFEPVEGPINDRVDEASRAKYGDNRYVPSMGSDLGPALPPSGSCPVNPSPTEIPEYEPDCRAIGDRPHELITKAKAHP